MEVRQLPENGTGIVQNERSDALSRPGELQGLFRRNSWKRWSPFWLDSISDGKTQAKTLTLPLHPCPDFIFDCKTKAKT